MARLPLCFFLGLAMVLAAAPKHPRKAGVFDYYVMSLSWAPDFCQGKAPGSVTNGFLSGNDECVPHRGFVLHGLWPENFDGSYPEFCPTNLTASPSFIPEMPAAIVAHEWRRHGACDVPGGTPADFFRKAGADFRSVKIPAQLQRPARPLMLLPADVARLFAAANGGNSARSFVTACTGNQVDVRVCLDRNGALTGCRIKSNCAPNTPLKFLPTN